MTEIELKFQVPEASRGAVLRAVATKGAQRTRLQALYFDTPDRRLAAAGIAVRMRLEGDHWVQTAKAGDPHAMVRHEHNVPVAAGLNGEPPALDLSRHDGTPAGTLVRRALREEAPVPLFRTDIERTHRVLRLKEGRVELALDIGRITAEGREWPVHELEIELVDGDPRCVIQAASDWVGRHGLWLDVRSKAERGDRLARDERGSMPTQAAPVVLAARAAGPALVQALVKEGLRHLLPNAAEVADAAGSPEHVHQVRVALRRLRHALRLAEVLGGAADPACQAALADAYHGLSGLRDRDAVAASWSPVLEQAGGPAVDLPPLPQGPSAASVLQAPAFTQALLALLALQLRPDAVSDGSAAPHPKRAAHAESMDELAKQLSRWHRQVRRAARHPQALDDAERHRLRRRVKRLADVTEFVGTLYPGKAVRRYLRRLEAAKEALGQLTDLQVATTLYRAAATNDPRAWFAVGWLTARQHAVVAASTGVLRRLARAEPYW